MVTVRVNRSTAITDLVITRAVSAVSITRPIMNRIQVLKVTIQQYRLMCIR